MAQPSTPKPRALRPQAKTSAPLREAGYAGTGGGALDWWSAPQETPELRWPLSVAVFDQMRRQDAQVKSVLRAVWLPVQSTPWRIDPAGARDEVVALVADDLGLPIVGAEQTPPRPRTRDRFSWLEHLNLVQLMLPFGHMFFEQVYRIDERGRGRLRKLAPRMPQTIARVNVEADGGLNSIEQYAPAGLPSPTVRISVNRLVAYVHEREGGNWLGTSLLRPAYKNWLLKDRNLRVWTQTIERNGMGVPVYTAADGNADLDAGHEMATSFRSGETAGGAVPFGAKMDLLGVSGSLPDAERAIRYHDEQIARAVLAHFLNLGGGSGSYALAAVQSATFTQSLQSVAQQVADVTTQHVIEDLVDINFGDDEPAPRLVFDPIGSQQLATATALKTLLDAGALTSDPELEAAVRQMHGLPPRPADAPPAPPPPAAPPPSTEEDEQ
ncbi:phage portal protein family protein [Kineococcus terrestris]|uniref:phage portal protein family protein n=1 Tax=Kineococcus terrestris TaxID=2044856 RepID=UPI0034DB4617